MPAYFAQVVPSGQIFGPLIRQAGWEWHGERGNEIEYRISGHECGYVRWHIRYWYVNERTPDTRIISNHLIGWQVNT
jgi:hypothetical protein